jgi:serine/threonine protein kinase
MALSPGTRLGPFEIVAKLGEGGMGEAYHGRDTKLHRDVAIKILPAVFAADAERLARFQREAQLLAALNHPNIGPRPWIEGATGAIQQFDLHPDGQRVAAPPLETDADRPDTVAFVFNFFDELRRIAPGSR